MILQNNIPGRYSRIISLVPSQTELLFYLGLRNKVIGITKFCIHPDEWFKSKTRVGGTKNINLKTIRELSPDLIIANKEENVKEQIEELAESYDIWLTDVNDLDDAISMIRDIGKLTECIETASALALQINKEFERLEKMADSKRKIRAAYFIWKDPYLVAGGNTFINDMMHYCGFKNVFDSQSRYPEISLKEIEEHHCELILLSSEPYPFKEKHRAEISQTIPGVKILLVDGEMFSWYGSRLLKSADYFRKILEFE